MTPNEMLTLAVAIIAAVISLLSLLISLWNYLRERTRDRRRISLYIEHIAFYETLRIVIVNTGHRPVTIVSVAAGQFLKMKGRKNFMDQVPQGALFTEHEDYEKLPLTLSDGEQEIFSLTNILLDDYYSQNMNFEVSVSDAEGHTWKSSKVRVFNPKWGRYESPRFDDLPFHQKIGGYSVEVWDRFKVGGKYDFEKEIKKFKEMDKHAKG